MTSALGDLDGLVWVLSAGCGDDHDIRFGLRQHLSKAGETGCASGGYRWFKPRRTDVANAHQVDVILMLSDSAEMVLGDTPAANQGKADLAVTDGRKQLGETHKSIFSCRQWVVIMVPLHRHQLAVPLLSSIVANLAAGT